MRLALFPRLFLPAVVSALVCIGGAASTGSAQTAIVGHVTAQGSQIPVPNARVIVVGTNAGAITAVDGSYRITNVRTGSQDVQVLRLGYQSLKKTVTVEANATATLDFVVEQAPTILDEVVRTATGDQRKIELGNAMAVVDAPTLIANAPIRDLSDLLTARAPSVVVIPGNYTGAAATIRIRGLSSISNSGPPIYIVDGIRINANTGVGLTGGGAQTSRLNDIVPSDIEDLQIVRGPSAATLYGTDAANGVVVITTKKGKPGHTSWTFQSEQGVLDDRNTYPVTYANWGHLPGSTTPTRCVLATISTGACISDSLTSANILANDTLSPIALGNRNLNSAQVQGGTDLARFFVSALLENETGPLKMPGFSIARLDSLNVPVRDEWVRPSVSQRVSFRANLSTTISPKFDMNFTSLFFKTDQRGAQSDNNLNSYFYNALTNPGFLHAGLGFTNVGSLGQDLKGYGGFTPGEIFQSFTNEDISRFGGSVNTTWRPYTWLQADGLTGVDLTTADNVSHCYLNECADFSTTRQGSVSENISNDRRFTAKATAAGQWQARSWANMTTTVGGDYLNAENDGSSASASQLGPGVENVALGANRSTSNTAPTATKTFGVFLQEQAAFKDLLFLTAAVRTDQNSAFGSKFQRVNYPKFSLSYVLSDEPWFRSPGGIINYVHIRSAYGESGIQPGATTSLVTFSTSTVHITNVDEPALSASQIGNQNLRPERTLETEGGVDIRAFKNRVSMELTYYSKQTNDALESYSYAPSASASSSITRNLGGVKNAGVEASLNVTIVDQQWLGMDVSVGGSHNKNKVTYLGFQDGGVPIAPTPRTSSSRTIAGYPLNSVWYRGYTYADSNHDGIITPNEVTVMDITKGDSAYFIGPSFPTDAVNITTGFDLLNRKLRITLLGTYTGGFDKFNNTQSFLNTSTVAAFAAENPAASLAEQARQIAQDAVLPAALRTSRGYSENLNFWRLREVTASYTLPDRFTARTFKARSASVVGAIRNVHTWTSYTGEDPEANYSTGNTQSDLLTSGPPTVFTIKLNLRY